jgi:hypothetical protein
MFNVKQLKGEQMQLFNSLIKAAKASLSKGKIDEDSYIQLRDALANLVFAAHSVGQVELAPCLDFILLTVNKYFPEFKLAENWSSRGDAQDLEIRQWYIKALTNYYQEKYQNIYHNIHEQDECINTTVAEQAHTDRQIITKTAQVFTSAEALAKIGVRNEDKYVGAKQAFQSFYDKVATPNSINMTCGKCDCATDYVAYKAFQPGGGDLGLNNNKEFTLLLTLWKNLTTVDVTNIWHKDFNIDRPSSYIYPEDISEGLTCFIEKTHLPFVNLTAEDMLPFLDECLA